MPNSRMKHRRVVHKSAAGIHKAIPEAVDLVDNPPPGLTSNTVARLPLRLRSGLRLTWMTHICLLLPCNVAGSNGPPKHLTRGR